MSILTTPSYKRGGPLMIGRCIWCYGDPCTCHQEVFQHFWRCQHHPIATQNFFDGRVACEWKCTEQPLQSHDNGFHPPKQQSWGEAYTRAFR